MSDSQPVHCGSPPAEAVFMTALLFYLFLGMHRWGGRVKEEDDENGR